VDIDLDAFALHLGAHYEFGTLSEGVNEFHRPALSQRPPLPCVRDTMQNLFRVFRRNHRLFQNLILAVQNHDWRLADMQPQFIRTIGVKEVKEVLDGIHAL